MESGPSTRRGAHVIAPCWRGQLPGPQSARGMAGSGRCRDTAVDHGRERSHRRITLRVRSEINRGRQPFLSNRLSGFRGIAEPDGLDRSLEVFGRRDGTQSPDVRGGCNYGDVRMQIECLGREISASSGEKLLAVSTTTSKPFSLALSVMRSRLPARLCRRSR